MDSVPVARSADDCGMKPAEREDLFANWTGAAWLDGSFEEYFVEKRVLGRGGTGVVSQVERLSDGRALAVKKMHERTEEGVNILMRELEVWQTLSQRHHPSVLMLLAAVGTPSLQSPTYFVTE